MRMTLLLSLLCVGSACTSYEFFPVEPLAVSHIVYRDTRAGKRLAPNVMIVLDTSGSMEKPTASGASRISEVRSAMGEFLQTYGAQARMGLATFPQAGSANGCGATTSIEVPLPAAVSRDDAATATENATVAAAINAAIGDTKRVPTGGTPTNFSLRYVAARPELNDTTDARRDYVLLLTDGVPNCNDTLPRVCGANSSCTCTLEGGCETVVACPNGCLDDSGAVAAVRALQARGITTIVVGFGADVSASDHTASSVLEQMARASGFQRTCERDANACGVGDTCLPNKQCARQYFQAQDATELSTELGAIISQVLADNVCEVTLDAEPAAEAHYGEGWTPAERLERGDSTSYMSVLLDGAVTLPGADTWVRHGQKVTFTGATCERIKQSLDVAPTQIEIRFIDFL